MKEADSFLEIFTHVETFLAFLFLIIPGFRSLRPYESRRGGEAKKVNEALVDVVIYSFATDIIWLPIIREVLIVPNSMLRAAFLAASAVGFIATAIFMGRGWYSLEVKLAKSGAVVDPIAKPWDKFFVAVARDNLDVGIVLP